MIFLTALCALEALVIAFLVHTLNRIIKAQTDVRTPVEPIQWEGWEND